MSQDQLNDELINEWLASGEAWMLPNGNIQLSDRIRTRLEKLLNEHPELYPQIFPDRLN